ncbi:hypothetical protein AB6A40_009710 [Gnathostoma spinigerum]|uniref:Uncharacterized protein n=1 Tax=Gnathostoma spinigerum TaxID=75299 RepID=A0ABD6ET19_9BILA
MSTETRARRINTKYSSRHTMHGYPRRAIEYMRWSLRNVWEGYLERDCQLKPGELLRLERHVYNATDVSWLDELCMKR